MDAYRFQVVMGQRQDGVFEADVPALPGCHAEGESIHELMQNVQKVISHYLEQEKKAADPMRSRYIRPSFWDRMN